MFKKLLSLMLVSGFVCHVAANPVAQVRAEEKCVVAALEMLYQKCLEKNLDQKTIEAVFQHVMNGEIASESTLRSFSLSDWSMQVAQGLLMGIGAAIVFQGFIELGIVCATKMSGGV